MPYSVKPNDWIYLVASFLCVVGAALSAFLYFSLPESDLEVLPSATQDLGQVKQGESASITYSLVNVTSRPLRISNVVTSCGCTTTSISRKEIAPDEKSVITLSYDSGQSRGPIHILAHVFYSDATSNEYESFPLEATGEIDPDYGIKPERLQFGRDVGFSRRVVVWPRHTQSLKVMNVACDKRFFKARIIEPAADGQVRIEVQFDPREYYQDAGPAHLSISTSSQIQPVALVPIEVVPERSITGQ